MLKWDLRSLFIVLGILIPHFMTIDKLHYIWPVDRQKYWHKVPRFSWSNYVGTIARKEWFYATTALISNFPKSLLPHFSHISATFTLILPLFMPLSFHFSSQKTGGKSCSKSGFFFCAKSRRQKYVTYNRRQSIRMSVLLMKMFFLEIKREPLRTE